MKTSEKVVVWAVCVAAGLGLWQAGIAIQNRPSGVHLAEIVVVSGCGAIDLNICRTVVGLDGTRLSRNGNFGEVGDSILVVQVSSTNWQAPTPARMQKYREGR